MQGWSTRAELDDKVGREDPWANITTKFNDPDFRPSNLYLDRLDGFDQIRSVDPSSLPNGAEVRYTCKAGLQISSLRLTCIRRIGWVAAVQMRTEINCLK